MSYTKDETDKAGIAVNLIFDNIVGFKYEQIAHTTTSERAVKGAEKALNQDDNACDAHECNNISKSAIGDITMTRKRHGTFYHF